MNESPTVIDKEAEAHEKRRTLQFEIMCYNSGGWGKGKTLEEAKKNCRAHGGRKGPYSFSIIPIGSEISDTYITYPLGATFLSTKLGQL